jgi:hypothetical protein
MSDVVPDLAHGEGLQLNPAESSAVSPFLSLHYFDRLPGIAVAQVRPPLSADRCHHSPTGSQKSHVGPAEYRKCRLDAKYERLFPYREIAAGKQRPTVGVIVKLLCSTAQTTVKARPAFGGRGDIVAARGSV